MFTGAIPIITTAVAVLAMRVAVVMATAVAVFVMIMTMFGLTVYALYFYRGVIVHMQALAAVIADFKRIEIAKFAFAAIYAIAIV